MRDQPEARLLTTHTDSRCLLAPVPDEALDPWMEAAA
jgi:hypothetical protein